MLWNSIPPRRERFHLVLRLHRNRRWKRALNLESWIPRFSSADIKGYPGSSECAACLRDPDSDKSTKKKLKDIIKPSSPERFTQPPLQ
jgi:hypothetical protein